MAVLSAYFKLQEDISEGLKRISGEGKTTGDVFETAGKNLKEALNGGEEALDKFISVTERSVTVSSTFRNGLGEQEEKLAKLQEAYVGLYLTQNQNTDSAVALRTEIDVLNREIEESQKALDEAERAAGMFGDTIAETGERSEEFGDKSVNAIEELSGALAAAGIARLIKEIYDGFANAVSKAIEFESALTGVYKTVDGTSGQLRSIRDDIKGMSTEMPASAVEIAGVAEAAGQLGIATNDITAFTEVMINLGEATNLTSDQAAASLAKFTNITGMSAQFYENLGSTVVALGNSFATTEADIVAMSTRMASAGTLAGLTESEILALAASMSSVGIEADAGGSAMSKLLTDIQVAVETGSDRLDEFAEVAGVTGREFQAAFGDSAVNALYMFIEGLNDVERNGESATVILEEMGITEVRLSNAVKSLANNHEGLNDAIQLASGAWEDNTALAQEAGLRYGTLESRIAMTQNAADNLAAAFGDKLTPVIGSVVDAGRGILEWATGVIEDYPAVSAVVSGVAVAFGAYATSVTVATVANSKLVAALKASSAAMLANPVAAVTVGVVALTAAIGTAVAVMKDQKSEYETWTASTRQQYDEIQRLNDEYERAVSVGNEFTAETGLLITEIDRLTNEFETNKQTIEQWTAENDKMLENHLKMMTEYTNTAESINNEEREVIALINSLDNLASKTKLTATEQERMEAVIDSLNGRLPDLALTYDQIADSGEGYVETMRKIAGTWSDNRRMENDLKVWAESHAKIEEETAKLEANERAMRDAQRRLSDLTFEGYDSFFGLGNMFNVDDRTKAQDDIDKYTKLYEESLRIVQEKQKLIYDIENGWDMDAKRESDAAEAAANAIVSYGSAVERAIDSVEGKVDGIIVAYNELYEAALDSVQGQYSLWDKAATVQATNLTDITNNLIGQTSYWENYDANLSTVIDRLGDFGNVDVASFVASFANSSEEAVNLVAGMATATDDEIQAMVRAYEESMAAGKEAADSLAEVGIIASGLIDDISDDVTKFVNELNMEDDARTEAEKTMQAYIEGIRSMIGSVGLAGFDAASALNSALSSQTTIPPGTPGTTPTTRPYESGVNSIPRHADGLDYVPYDDYLARLHEGERVLTADENRAYTLSEHGNNFYVAPPENLHADNSVQNSERRVVLDINGSGGIDVTGGVDDEQIWDAVQPRLKVAFLDILNKEVFEEGDGSYVF